MKFVVLDTSLVVLLVVGFTSRSLIGKHKRTRNTFTNEDYEILKNLLQRYHEVIITPNILTESYNLIAQIGEPDKTLVMKTLRWIVNSYKEQYKPSAKIVNKKIFFKVGITDAGILDILNNQIDLITMDLDLHLAALEKNKNSFNFNHLRNHLYKI